MRTRTLLTTLATVTATLIAVLAPTASAAPGTAGRGPRHESGDQHATQRWQRMFGNDIASAASRARASVDGYQARVDLFADHVGDFLPGVVAVVRVQHQKLQVTVRDRGRVRSVCVVLPGDDAAFRFAQNGSERPGTWHPRGCRG